MIYGKQKINKEWIYGKILPYSVSFISSFGDQSGKLCNCMWTHNVTLTLAFQNNENFNDELRTWGQKKLPIFHVAPWSAYSYCCGSSIWQSNAHVHRSPFSLKMALPVYRDKNDNVVKCLHSGARLQKLDSTTLGTILKGANLTKPCRFRPFWLSHKYFNKYVNIQSMWLSLIWVLYQFHMLTVKPSQALTLLFVNKRVMSYLLCS